MFNIATSVTFVTYVFVFNVDRIVTIVIVDYPLLLRTLRSKHNTARDWSVRSVHDRTLTSRTATLYPFLL